MSRPMFTCRGGAARTEIERALCLQALDEILDGKNVDLWKARILLIYKSRQAANPGHRYGGHMDGEWRSIEDMCEIYGENGVLKAWNIYKNERKGCGYPLDNTIKELEAKYAPGTETYRTCPRCGDRDPITIGVTKWRD